MRRTVTLDPDVERSLRTLMRERSISFKQALNESTRKGLIGAKRQSNGRFVQKTFSLGAGQDMRWDKGLTMAEAMEDEEISRKLLLGK